MGSAPVLPGLGTVEQEGDRDLPTVVAVPVIAQWIASRFTGLFTPEAVASAEDYYANV